MIPAFRRIRAFAPGGEVPLIATYLGSPDELLAHRAATDPRLANFDSISRLYWGSLRSWLRPDPVVIALRPFYDHYDSLLKANPSGEIADGVMVLRGPRPAPGFLPPEALSPPGAGSLAAWTAAAFVVLLVAGLGWAWGLLQLSWDERLALAPALGITTLVLIAFVLAMMGVSLSGGSGRIVVAITVIAGWAVAAGRRWAGRHRVEPEDEQALGA